MDPVVWSEFPAAGLQNVPEKRVILGSWRGIDILQTCHGLSNPKVPSRIVCGLLHSAVTANGRF